VVTNELKHPVETVSWNDATNYCARLTQRERQAGRIPTNYVYCLPTESEWEYACRGGMANFYAYYEYDAAVGDINVPTSTNYQARTSLVGSYVPNAFGLSDMHGNVWEWCSDWYGSYPAGSVTNPVGSATVVDRVVRGAVGATAAGIAVPRAVTTTTLAIGATMLGSARSWPQVREHRTASGAEPEGQSERGTSGVLSRELLVEN